MTERFQVADGSLPRIQQLLSLLDYSPLAWTPSGAPIASSDAKAQLAALYTPPAGSYTWRNRGWPASLRVMWLPGVDSIFTRGLIMSFQADHALTPNGDIGASLWTALIDALSSNVVNTGGYNYPLANKAVPESLTIYHDGAVAVQTPANTGIAASPTPDGTFTVYERLRSQVMKRHEPRRFALRRSRPVHRVLSRQRCGSLHGPGRLRNPAKPRLHRASDRGRGTSVALPRLRDTRHDHQLRRKRREGPLDYRVHLFTSFARHCSPISSEVCSPISQVAERARDHPSSACHTHALRARADRGSDAPELFAGPVRLYQAITPVGARDGVGRTGQSPRWDSNP